MLEKGCSEPATYGDDRLSGPTRRRVIANKRLTDIPDLNTPIRLSAGPNSRRFNERVTSPQPTVAWLLAERRL